MLISESKKFIFVHNQRAGGASVREYLEKQVPDTRYLLPNHAFTTQGIEKLGREAWNTYYSFGFVRNLWDRLASWDMRIINPPQEEPKKRNVNLENDLWKYVRGNFSDFEDFIKNATKTITEVRNEFHYEKSFVKNQLDYFTDGEGKI